MSPEFVKENMEKINDGFFHVYFSTSVDHHPVQVSLGFQRQGAAGQYDTDLMGLIPEPNRDNKIDKNIFLLVGEGKVSIREGLNLMQGRSVFRPAKDHSQKDTWLTLVSLNSNSSLNKTELKRSIWKS